MKGAWWLLEYLPQQDPHPKGKRLIFPRGRDRVIPPSSYIHESVRIGKWCPGNLPDHIEEPWVELTTLEDIAPAKAATRSFNDPLHESSIVEGTGALGSPYIGGSQPNLVAPRPSSAIKPSPLQTT
jgi:hypothetical protein